jgi:hypothetical protein
MQLLRPNENLFRAKHVAKTSLFRYAKWYFGQSASGIKYYVIEQKGERIAARISCPFSLLFKQLSKLASKAYCCGCFFFLAAARMAKNMGIKAIGTAAKAIGTAADLDEWVR